MYPVEILGGHVPPQSEASKILGGHVPPHAPPPDRLWRHTN